MAVVHFEHFSNFRKYLSNLFLFQIRIRDREIYKVLEFRTRLLYKFYVKLAQLRLRLRRNYFLTLAKALAAL